VEEVDIIGQMENIMKVNGRKIRCMVMVFLFGKTVKNTKENL
jgi:hypothetical protein